MKRNVLTIKAIILCLSFLAAISGIEAQDTPDDLRKLDVFSGSSWEDAMARLDNLALALQNESGTTGVLIVYGGRRGKRGELKAWSTCLKDYLVNRRGINGDRVVMINGGYRESLTVELFAMVNKRVLPDPEPTVKPKDVRFRGRISKWRRLCNI